MLVWVLVEERLDRGTLETHYQNIAVLSNISKLEEAIKERFNIVNTDDDLRDEVMGWTGYTYILNAYHSTGEEGIRPYNRMGEAETPDWNIKISEYVDKITRLRDIALESGSKSDLTIYLTTLANGVEQKGNLMIDRDREIEIEYNLSLAKIDSDYHDQLARFIKLDRESPYQVEYKVDGKWMNYGAKWHYFDSAYKELEYLRNTVKYEARLKNVNEIVVDGEKDIEEVIPQEQEQEQEQEAKEQLWVICI